MTLAQQENLSYYCSAQCSRRCTLIAKCRSYWCRNLQLLGLCSGVLPEKPPFHTQVVPGCPLTRWADKIGLWNLWSFRYLLDSISLQPQPLCPIVKGWWEVEPRNFQNNFGPLSTSGEPKLFSIPALDVAVLQLPSFDHWTRCLRLKGGGFQHLNYNSQQAGSMAGDGGSCNLATSGGPQVPHIQSREPKLTPSLL